MQAMRWLLSITVLLLMALPSRGMAGPSLPDSTKMAALDSRLDEYVKALEKEDIPSKEKECDFIISTCQDSLVRQHVALKLYSHYINSRIMGEEAVAVHITDTWFSPGKVSMGNEVDLMNAKIYADFNRASLLGKQAPQVSLQDSLGVTCDVFGVEKGGFPLTSRNHRVVYFYDIHCARCAVESAGLKRLLSRSPMPVDFYAVYTGSDRDGWLEYASSALDIEATGEGAPARVFHFWDPEVQSDFQRKWGVLGTPRLFLVSPRGIILGRGLDTEALFSMLSDIASKSVLSYGSEVSHELFERLFGENPTVGNIDSVAAYASSRALSLRDTVGYKQFIGDMFYYMTSKRGAVYKKALGPFMDEHILSRPDIWSSADDSLKIVGLAEFEKALLGKTPVGSRIPREFRGKKRTNYLVFYTEGCNLCSETLEAAARIRKRPRTGVNLVNVDELLAEDPSAAKSLFDTFDLSALPLVLETTRRGVVKDRYLSLPDLLAEEEKSL